jgi:hypothetical protein
VPEVARKLGVLPNTLHKAIRAERLHQPRRKKVAGTSESEATSKSQRSETDSAAVMGYATTRSDERVAAARGVLAAAPILFETALSPQTLHVTLHRFRRHVKRARDLGLAHSTLHHQLAGEQPESGQVVWLMLKHGQMPTQIGLGQSCNRQEGRLTAS